MPKAKADLQIGDKTFPNRIDTSVLDEQELSKRGHRFAPGKRRRASAPKMQMTVRMSEDAYVRFKTLAEEMRMTNGDALEIITDFFIENGIK